MDINTKYFGMLKNILGFQMIFFKEGLLGISNLNKYVLFDMPGNEKIKCLQSVNDINIAFFMIKPWDFFGDYDIFISDIDLGKINIRNEKEIAIFNIITVPKELSKMTANLLAPVIINIESKEAMQYVLKNEQYGTKHYIFPEKKEEQ